MVPRLVPCDMSRVKLAAPERFVASKIDGRRSVDEIARLVGIDAAGVRRIVDRLVALGAVRWDGGSPTPPPRSATRPSTPPEPVTTRRSLPPDSTPTIRVADVQIPDAALGDDDDEPTSPRGS